jgi:hemerythrin-like domain-containing protein
VSEALDRLASSHRRHDEEMSALLEAARAGDEGVVADVLDFLERTTPRHFADEEESLFPRLVARAPDLADAVARLIAEHRDHERIHARLRVRFDAGDLPAVLAEAEGLDALYRRHVAEEDALLPRIAAILDADELAAIAAEMQGRRGRR